MTGYSRIQYFAIYELVSILVVQNIQISRREARAVRTSTARNMG